MTIEISQRSLKAQSPPASSIATCRQPLVAVLCEFGVQQVHSTQGNHCSCQHLWGEHLSRYEQSSDGRRQHYAQS